MRKLLIKLVAIETALVGWLSYWVFLIYANNPSVAAELGASLQRFPQLSFSTIDIAVLVIIAALAVTLAFKFQRGLRPGIRLERALQMLENLMKRNLILESQVAELKIDKSHTGPMIAPPAAAVAQAPVEEPRAGSWEKAFRTPLEAGPPPSPRPSGIGGEDIPFGHQMGVPPPRIEPKQPTPSTAKPAIMITDKGVERTSPPPTIIPNITEKTGYSGPPSSSSSWEDSPKFISESRGVITPSAQPRKAPTLSESGGLKQPYIPAPAPKTTSPSVIVGPLTGPMPPKPPPLSSSLRIPRPSVRSIASPKTSTSASPHPSGDTDMPNPDAAGPATSTPTPPMEPALPVNLGQIRPTSTGDHSIKTETFASKPPHETVKPDEKTRTRDSQPTKKKSSIVEEEQRNPVEH